MVQADILALFAAGRDIHYKKNEYIIRAEDQPSGVYIVQQGIVKAFSSNDKGEQYTHLLYAAGEIFPLVWGISGTWKAINFQAVDDVVVRRISREHFMNIATGDKQAATQLLQYIARYLVVYSERVENLTYHYASERVAYRLLFLADRFGSADAHGHILLKLPLTQDDIAAATSLTRRTVSRELGRLQRKGCIDIKQRTICITDLPMLQNELPNTLTVHTWK